MSVIEVVVSVSIIGVAIVFLIFSVSRSVRVARETLYRGQAIFIAEEGIESLRVIRDRSWSNLSGLVKGSVYYFSLSSTTATTSVAWLTTTTPQKIGIFTRSFVTSSAYRDASDRLVATGTLDTKTLKINVDVKWLGYAGTSTESVQTYMSDTF